MFDSLLEEQREEALLASSRKKPLIAHRVEPAIEQAVIALAIEWPAYGQLRVANALKKQGIILSPGGVRSIWLRHELNNLKKRLHALEAKIVQDGMVLTERQLQALEKQQANKEA